MTYHKIPYIFYSKITFFQSILMIVSHFSILTKKSAETKDRTVLKRSEKKLSEYFESILNEIFEEGRINHKKDGRLNVYNKGIYKYQYAKIPAVTTIKDLRKKLKIAMKKIEEGMPLFCLKVL